MRVRLTGVGHAASQVDIASAVSSRSTPSLNDKDEGYQSIVNPASAPPTTSTDLHLSYNPSDATTPALIEDCGTNDSVSSIILPDQLLEVSPGSKNSSTQSLPSIITPALLQPALQDLSPLKENTNGRYSTAAKGKGKALPEEQASSGKGSAEPQFAGPLEELNDEDLLYPSPEFSSTEQWVAHTRSILQDYANRQTALPLGRRVNISLNEPSQFIQGAMELLANRDHPQEPPIEPSRQLGPQLLDNFTDVHRWATEYFRARFGMSTAGSDIPVLLTIITNTFYEAHTQLIDSIASAAIDNMRDRGAANLDIEDFAFGYDFKMSHDLPFAVESCSRIHDTLERHRPRSPVEIPIDLTVTTRSGRQIKLSKQAQAAAQAEREKQTKSRQRKKEKAKKQQQGSTLPLETPKLVSETKRETTPEPATTSAAVRTPTATVYHTPNYRTPNPASLMEMGPNVYVLSGAKCPTCGRVMPRRTDPSDPDLASQSLSTASPNTSSSQWATTLPAVSSNLRVAPITAQVPPPAVPLPTGLPPSALHVPSTQPTSDPAAHTNSSSQAMPVTPDILAGTARSAPASEATIVTSRYQNLAQATETTIRGGRRIIRVRGSGARGRGGKASAPLTIIIPARPHPVAAASTANATASASTQAIAPDDAVRSYPSGGSGGGSGITPTHTANPIPTIASTERPACTEIVRTEPVSTTSGSAGHAVVVPGSPSTYYPQNHYPQTAAARSTVNTDMNAATNTATNNTANNTVNTSGPYSTYIPGPIVSTLDYHSSNTTTAKNTTAITAARLLRGRANDFSDPELWAEQALSVDNSPGFRAEASGSVAGPTVAAANGGGAHNTLASGSHVETRQSKKRKLDASE